MLYRLSYILKKYPWGSKSLIPELLGFDNKTGEPLAELWLGTHPMGPSSVLHNETSGSLANIIEKNPVEILGNEVAERFNRSLPFLFKVLAAEKPLSIQVHPDGDQALSGFKRENSMGITPGDPSRNYHDRNHKPEIICALAPFTALYGFRSGKQIGTYMKVLAHRSLYHEIEILEKEGLKNFYRSLLTLPHSRLREILNEALAAARGRQSDDSVFAWIVRLSETYPDDPGILSPAILNLVELEPGQALSLHAGLIHAYLHGIGIEVMANSDNVIRGGLTSKHIDVDELISITRFEESPVKILDAERASATEKRYPVTAGEFLLSEITLHPGDLFESSEKRSVEIMLCIEGSGTISFSHESHVVSRGESILIPASSPQYRITGECRFFKATVPLR